jgi:hypothetical protein
LPVLQLSLKISCGLLALLLPLCVAHVYLSLT